MPAPLRRTGFSLLRLLGLVLSPCHLLPASSGILGASASSSSAPITAADYQARIGWGFDTDFFKSTTGLKKYDPKIMVDLKAKGVKNLRLRTRGDIFGFNSATEVVDSASLQELVKGYRTVLPDMYANGIFPIISWINDASEVQATDAQGDNFVEWWGKVAEELKDEPYELSFNLFTEIGDGNLKDDPAKYNDWTRRAISAIRSTGGNNGNRVIILGAPAKDADSLSRIDASITTGQQYLMAEWHLYASGPNKQVDGQKYWAGTGSSEDRERVNKVFRDAMAWTASTDIPTWIGAWMPYDNIGATLSQEEVEAFACYFASVARDNHIPWSMNKLDNFYDVRQKSWVQTQDIGRSDAPVTLSMPPILDALQCSSAPPLPLTKSNADIYLAQRRVEQSRARSQDRHRIHRSFMIGDPAAAAAVTRAMEPE
ncbi:hypothetical protein GUITHDRAFT_100344 [Guillardia theta CCMP2712]|uniref:Glycoside hydrolase family 5 domain-containing protein n=1 Tax=Guillardia theta (strain CCMP2712) TaxID=905079 RepID=L1K0E5_GUITC|nr:hypothetical protein GUITHDRAFT_100344 [Guillardia theta CCMP2712]EKX54097.1 hypothetical protein GUITHDRAFT_100344 [Guillardia theta CCMP2712]|eukprot:XP_005841077.1 hypothetical protein GUITHDRAFT_100344 [Guillardia theta CCMP2712]